MFDCQTDRSLRSSSAAAPALGGSLKGQLEVEAVCLGDQGQLAWTALVPVGWAALQDSGWGICRRSAQLPGHFG